MVYHQESATEATPRSSEGISRREAIAQSIIGIQIYVRINERVNTSIERASAGPTAP